ncbi:MAG TPA: molybdopterin cofactor-binding domain-containing protein, partial [Burkholderiales bacterium]|nr:molybdopterin cofactor-binding domain-containing protein [Burkholderiales bacterium]
MLMEKISRRDFLKSSGALVVTFSLGSPLAGAATQGAAAAKTVASDQVDGFLAIDAKGNVTLYSGKVDLGTGVRTALAQIAAEELSVPFEKVDVVEGDTALTPDQGITWGSLTIQNGGMQIRQACATARAALLAQGAEKLGVQATEVHAKDGRVMVLGSERGVSYGELVSGRNFQMKVDKTAPAKPPSAYSIVGRSVKRVDIPDKVTGRFTYMHDFRVKGMLHGRVVRPAGIRSDLLSMDDSAARKVPGYVATVRKGNFLAAVARSEWGAIQGAGAIRASWSDWQGLPDKAKLWEHVRGTKVAKREDLQKVGN